MQGELTCYKSQAKETLEVPLEVLPPTTTSALQRVCPHCWYYLGKLFPGGKNSSKSNRVRALGKLCSIQTCPSLCPISIILIILIIILNVSDITLILTQYSYHHKGNAYFQHVLVDKSPKTDVKVKSTTLSFSSPLLSLLKH